MSTILQHMHGWKEVTRCPSDAPIFALVRHPVDRWVSGICQDFSPWTAPSTRDADPSIEKIAMFEYLWNMNHQQFNLFLNKVGHTKHTQTQFKYLLPFAGLSKLRLFKLENMSYLLHELNLTNQHVHIRNHKDLGLQGELYSKVMHHAKQEHEKIEKMYKLDLELYKGAE